MRPGRRTIQGESAAPTVREVDTRGARLTGGRLAVLAVIALVVAACSSGADDDALVLRPTAGQATAGQTTTTSAPPTTVPAAPGPDVPKPPPAGLGPGSKGPAVASLEQRLNALRYDVARVDDTFDQNTAYAVMAFQKVNRMQRTGRATDDVVTAVNSSKSPPPPLVPGGGDTRVEIDLDRQVLFLYEGNNLSKILPVSTGSNQRFCSEGWCRRAVTNVGSFAVNRQARGWQKSPLGRLYNPLYFDGGIAIHGSQSVPASPVSHGCVRIPMAAAEWFPTRVTMGTPVYVAGSGKVPPPTRPSSNPPPPSASTPAAPTTPTVPPITFTPPVANVPQAPPTTAPGGLLMPPPTP